MIENQLIRLGLAANFLNSIKNFWQLIKYFYFIFGKYVHFLEDAEPSKLRLQLEFQMWEYKENVPKFQPKISRTYERADDFKTVGECQSNRAMISNDTLITRAIQLRRKCSSIYILISTIGSFKNLMIFDPSALGGIHKPRGQLRWRWDSQMTILLHTFWFDGSFLKQNYPKYWLLGGSYLF